MPLFMVLHGSSSKSHCEEEHVCQGMDEQPFKRLPYQSVGQAGLVSEQFSAQRNRHMHKDCPGEAHPHVERESAPAQPVHEYVFVWTLANQCHLISLYATQMDPKFPAEKCQ